MKKVICNYKLFVHTQNAVVIDTETGEAVEIINYTLDNVSDIAKAIFSKYDDIESLDLYGLKSFSQKIKDTILSNIAQYNKNIEINIK